NYERYEENLEKLREEFSSINESEWGRNLYWGWIYALKALIEPRGQGYPSYMRTKAWERRQLYTALASWAELRHDTILYAKQSYTIEVTAVPPSPSTVTVYVEPVPEVYARLSSLVEMTRKGLKELGFLNQTQEERLLMLKEVLDKLVEISKKELEMAPLTSDDLAFLEQIPGELEAIVEDLDERSRSTILVADVHTDQNSGLVLEEGVGRLDLIIVVVPTDEDRLLIAAGPSLSYYEFKQPMSNRLTDEAWKQMLETSPPDRPGWISDFFEPVSVGS
ncbi:MAG: dTDP-glucose 4,6-dehydratase, partial [Thermoproteota archaeon]